MLYQEYHYTPVRYVKLQLRQCFIVQFYRNTTMAIEIHGNVLENLSVKEHWHELYERRQYMSKISSWATLMNTKWQARKSTRTSAPAGQSDVSFSLHARKKKIKHTGIWCHITKARPADMSSVNSNMPLYTAQPELQTEKHTICCNTDCQSGYSTRRKHPFKWSCPWKPAYSSKISTTLQK